MYRVPQHYPLYFSSGIFSETACLSQDRDERQTASQASKQALSPLKICSPLYKNAAMQT
jgi:hypothetical protein